jgi:outer membrane protein TolC
MMTCFAACVGLMPAAFSNGIGSQEQQRDLLNALVGHFPSGDVGAKFGLEGFDLPRSLPVTIPAKLIDQRPDVRMAEEQLHSACAEIGVAIGNLLPSISLSANGGNPVNYFSQFLVQVRFIGH